MAKAAKKQPAAPPPTPAPEVPRPEAIDRRFWMIAAGLIAACLAIYGQVISHDFINYDDPNYVIRNANVNRGLTVAGLAWAFSTFDFYYWQPLTWISHMIDCQLFGLNPGRHHAVNVVFHAANAVLLFVALRQLTGALWRSALAAALFAVHPLRVESVAWIAERKDVLSGLFWMLGLLAYGWYVRGPSAKRLAATGVAFACGIMSKPSTVTFPFVLLLLDWWPLNRVRTIGWMRLIREKAPMFILVAGASALTFTGQKQMGATVSLQALPFWFRIWNALVSYIKYLGKFFWPVDLGVLYPYSKIPAGEMLGAALLLVAISGWMLLRARRYGYLFTGWFWFLGAMVPMIGLAQTGLQAMADRFTYLPMIGLCVIAAWVGSRLTRSLQPGLRAATGSLAVGILAFASMLQTSHWKDSFTLFTHTIGVTRDNDVMHLNIGGLYEERGQLEKALPHFLEAVRIEPTNIEAHHITGTIHARLRNHERALDHFRTAIKLKPRHVEARKQAAAIYAATGRVADARQELLRVLEISPGDVEARAKLMMLR